MTVPVIPFRFKSTEVRTLEINNQIWFVASDVAKALHYRDAANITRVLDEEEKGTHIMSTPSGDQEMATINESGLYHAILKSRKPEAQPFRKWVTSEVLPAIRKTGKYEAAPAPSLRNRRWLLSTGSDGREQITPVPDDASVMTKEQMLVALNDPSSTWLSTEQLSDLATATIQRLAERCTYYEAKARKK